MTVKKTEAHETALSREGEMLDQEQLSQVQGGVKLTQLSALRDRVVIDRTALSRDFANLSSQFQSGISNSLLNGFREPILRSDSPALGGGGLDNIVISWPKSWQ